MRITIFTNGTVAYGKQVDGADLVRIDFAADQPRILQRHELELQAGMRLETTGAVAESFGKGGTVLEIASLEELQGRFSDEKILSEATGSCRLGYDDHGIAQCDQGSCSGACRLKTFLFWTWCSCS